MASALMKQLLEAGAHFGHSTRKWDPKMAPFIHGERNGIHIIDLRKTVKQLEEACKFVYSVAAKGEEVLFVGTKKQAKDSVAEEAAQIQAPYVSERWLGGMLTNFETIRKSIQKLTNIETMEADGSIQMRPKKEILKLRKLSERLTRNLAGFKNLKKLPGALVAVDIGKESIAVAEARTLGIPVIAIVDTNCNPNMADICIPSNDDAIKATKMILNALAEAVRQGQLVYAEYASSQAAEQQIKSEEQQMKEAAEAPKSSRPRRPGKDGGSSRGGSSRGSSAGNNNRRGPSAGGSSASRGGRKAPASTAKDSEVKA